MSVLVVLLGEHTAGIHAVATRRRPERIGKVVLVDGEDVAAEAWHGFELHGGCEAPGLTVVAGAVD